MKSAIFSHDNCDWLSRTWYITGCIKPYLDPKIDRYVSQLSHQTVQQKSQHYIQDVPMNIGTPIFKIHKIQQFVTIC